MAEKDKSKWNKVSQRQYEEAMDKKMKNVVKETQKMAMAKTKTWIGEPKDSGKPQVSGSEVLLKESAIKKKGKK